MTRTILFFLLAVGLVLGAEDRSGPTAIPSVDNGSTNTAAGGATEPTMTEPVGEPETGKTGASEVPVVVVETGGSGEVVPMETLEPARSLGQDQDGEQGEEDDVPVDGMVTLEPAPPEVLRPLVIQLGPEAVQAVTETAVVSAVNAAMDSVVPAVDALAGRLAQVEHSLEAQSRSSLEETRNTTRTILLVAGCFAVALLLGVLIASLILARAMQRMSEVVAAALPPSRQLTAGGGLVGPELPGLESSAAAPVEQVTNRFLSAIEKLERRILELEQTAHPTSRAIAESKPGNGAESLGGGNGEPLEFSVSALSQKQYGHDLAEGESAPAIVQAPPVDLWLGKGQALLSMGNNEEALSCFDQALELSPGHADALVKRGMVLEKMERMEEAIESYDQAIAADDSMTLAYLYKGAICNRLQRYREALECYESALRCEQKLVGG